MILRMPFIKWNEFYNLKLIKIVITTKFKSFTLYQKKPRQNIKTFRYDWISVDRNCPEYGMCPVYGELTHLQCKKHQSAK